VVIWDKKSGGEVKRLVGHTKTTVGGIINPGNPFELVTFGEDHSFIVHISELHFN
jgi:hypothetical protein